MDNKLKQMITEYIENHKSELFSLLSELIKINSENFGTHGNEKFCADFVAEKLRGLEIEHCIYAPDSVPGILQHKDYLSGRGTSERPNVSGVIKGRSGEKALMLTAHIDTVPIGDEALWTVPPLGGIIKNGRIYGRGACDDKYAVATILFVMGMLKELHLQLENDLYFTGYVDEEFGGGNGALAACLKYPCDAYVNLDCKNMRIWNCAAGGRRERLTLEYGNIADTCDTMIEAIYRAKKELHVFGENRKKDLMANHRFDGHYVVDKSMRILEVQSGLNTNDRNMAHIEFAYYTDKDEEEINVELLALKERLNSTMKDIGVCVKELKPVTRYFRYACSESDNELITLLQNSGKLMNNEDIIVEASCLSDLSIFINNGSASSFSFGIGRDFDVPGGAHLADEFVECEKLVDFVKAVAAFVCEWGQVRYEV